MTVITSGCGGGAPSPSMPPERTDTGDPSPARRRASKASAIGDRQMFAVQSSKTSDSEIVTYPA